MEWNGVRWRRGKISINAKNVSFYVSSSSSPFAHFHHGLNIADYRKVSYCLLIHTQRASGLTFLIAVCIFVVLLALFSSWFMSWQKVSANSLTSGALFSKKRAQRWGGRQETKPRVQCNFYAILCHIMYDKYMKIAGNDEAQNANFIFFSKFLCISITIPCLWPNYISWPQCANFRSSILQFCGRARGFNEHLIENHWNAFIIIQFSKISISLRDTRWKWGRKQVATCELIKK